MRCLRMSSILIVTSCLSLVACGSPSGAEADETALEIRTDYLAMERCSATVDLTADYGERVYEYGLTFSYERAGETVLMLTAPEAAAGVSAHIRAGETTLEYDGIRVETGPLDSAGLSPMDAVPALLAAVREGYLAETALEGTEEAGGQALHMVIRDPDVSAGSGTEYQLWFDPRDRALLQGEVSVDGHTVVRCMFSDWSMSGPETAGEGGTS